MNHRFSVPSWGSDASFNLSLFVRLRNTFMTLSYRRDNARRAINHIGLIAKLDYYLGYMAGHGLASVNLTQLGTQSAVMDYWCETMYNDGHWVVQGHSRSPMYCPTDQKPVWASSHRLRVIVTA